MAIVYNGIQENPVREHGHELNADMSSSEMERNTDRKAVGGRHSDQQQRKTKKTVFTLNIDNYAPEITKLTYPFLETYAKKINAEFRIIAKRKFPGYPLMYEKLQIYELGQDNDWNIYIDSDVLVHPDLFDITEVLPEDTALSFVAFFAGDRFRYDNYFRRDGRNIGSANEITVASHLCHDIWEPLSDITVDDALKNIQLLRREEVVGHTGGYGIDDYVISRNMAKYGIKFKTFTDLLNEIGRPNDEYFYHEWPVAEKDKAEKIKARLKFWKYT